MKTIIVMLAVAFAAPTWAQTSNEPATTTTTQSTTTTAPADAAAPMDETAPGTAAAVPGTADESTTSRAYSERPMMSDVQGGFYIEPGLVGARQDTDFAGAGADNEIDSFGFDLKLGGHINETFFGAINGRYQRSQLGEEGFTEADADIWNVGPTIGAQVPYLGARLYGTYVLDGSFNPEATDQNLDLNFEDPYGWRAGIGFRFTNVSINLEYEDLTYTTTNVESLGDLAATDLDGDFAHRGYAVNLSSPFDL